jgi:PAS domain S-box-containing protein
MKATHLHQGPEFKARLLKKKQSNVLAEVAESDPNFRLFFKNTNEGIIIVQDEKFCFINSKMAEITGYNKEELISNKFTEFTYPADRKILLDWYRRRLRGEYTNAAYPFRFITSTGETKWLLGTSIKIDWHDKPAVMGFITDITPQKQTKEQPNSPEMLFRALFNNGNIGAFHISLEGALLYVNRSFADIFEYDSAKEMVSSKIFENDTNKKTLQSIIQSVEKTKNIKNSIFEVITKKGQSKSLSCDVSLHQDTVFGMVTNVGERTPIEKQLQNKTEALQTLLNASHDIALLVDKNGIVQAINTTAAEKLGKSPDELFDSKIYNYMPNEVASFQKSQLNKALHTKRPVRYHESRNGRIYHTHIYPTSKNDGEVELIAIFSQEVTKGIQSKKALHESHMKLERKVVNRTKDFKRKARQLEEANIALKVLLKKRDEDKIDLESRLMRSAKELVLPYLHKLKRGISNEKKMTYLNILEANINSVFTPFSRRLIAVYSLLTPSEIEVAELIKFGKSSKEIAELLNVSVKTIETHRAKIRKKVGLTHQKANLRTHLLTLK